MEISDTAELRCGQGGDLLTTREGDFQTKELKRTPLEGGGIAQFVKGGQRFRAGLHVIQRKRAEVGQQSVKAVDGRTFFSRVSAGFALGGL